MARFARVVIPGTVHHVTQRGNHRQPVFLSDHDRRVYQELVGKYFSRYSLKLIGYSWMSNHVHQASIPGHRDSLAKGVGRAHEDYSRWFQTQQCTSGHLWGDRYFSCLVENVRVLETLLYIELNPVRAGLVTRAWDWPWSSARAHVTGYDESGFLDMTLFRQLVEPEAWREMLEKAVKDELFYEEIRAATRTGRPLGSDAFVSALEEQLGRVLRPLPRGCLVERPKGVSGKVIPVELDISGLKLSS